MEAKKMNIVKRIAIVAHDSAKNELIEWSFHNREILKQHEIIAAGYTADVLEGTLNIPVHKLLNEVQGGYKQLGEMITSEKVDVIIFLGLPKKAEPADIEMKTLLQLAEGLDLVIALNMSTAEAILHSNFLNCEESFTTAGNSFDIERKAV